MTRCGVVAVIGAPNAGKSTLVNQLVGQKVAITSAKAQTTRARLLGIALADETQMILVDTPGIFAPKRRLDRAMVTTAWGGAHDADLVCAMIDAKRGFDDDTAALFGKLGDVRQPRLLVINKVDTVDKPSLLALTARANETLTFSATFMVSALNGSGVADLRKHLARAVPAGPRARRRCRPRFPNGRAAGAKTRRHASEDTLTPNG